MKTPEEIKKILEEQFYRDVLYFHIDALQRIYDARGFLKKRREIINKAVSSIIEGKECRKFVRRLLKYLYGDIRNLHMAALQDAIGLNAFQKRKKEIINDAVCSRVFRR